MIVDTQGQLLTTLDPHVLELTVIAHRITNREAYFMRYNHRRFLLDSGCIDRWRSEGHAAA